MLLNIKAHWNETINLEYYPPSYPKRIYYSKEIENIPEESGIYVFGRKFGGKVYPLYIGRADKLQSRIKQQLNSASLMLGIENAPTGQRVLLYCTVALRQGQKKNKVLKSIEKSLLDHAISEKEKYLLNIQGAKSRISIIKFTGTRDSEKIVPRKISFQPSDK